MRKFGIRDDDTSFFTAPDELDAVYGRWWGVIPISLAVVPFSCSRHKGRLLGQVDGSRRIFPLEENRQLVQYLRERIRAGQLEIMLHGHTHEYQLRKGRWIGEYAWKSATQLAEETERGKRYLEQLLSCRVRVFVPPGNAIGIAGIRAIRAVGLNLSGIMGRKLDRPPSIRYFFTYAKRWYFRATQGRPYPWPIAVNGAIELIAYSLTSQVRQIDLLNSLEYCAGRNAPFVVATHYWEFAKVPAMQEILLAVVEAAKRHQYHFCKVSECMQIAQRRCQ